ncbi:hypothetical protein HDU98_012110 [Podochytrium sp. JEL0797]|nr:hypothetical protein HDU98_012110 [Podochytrium sp. JEL0797]
MSRSFTIAPQESRARSNSLSSEGSDHLVCSCEGDKESFGFVVAPGCQVHWPRAATHECAVRPILRMPSSPALSELAAKPRLRRISFSSESLCLFSNDDAPVSVKDERVYANPVAPPAPSAESCTSPISPLFDCPEPVPQWAILSTTTPSLQLDNTKVSFESAHLKTTDSTSIKLHVTAIVQNLAFDKEISILYTTDSWKSSRSTTSAKYVGCVSSPYDNISGIDRFSLELEIDTSSSTRVIGTPDRVINIEFAVKCVMGGQESWDSRFGMNHLIILKSRYSLSPPSSPRFSNGRRDSNSSLRSSPSALDMEAEMIRKRRASVVALRMAAAVADEAEQIDAEFQLELKRGMELDAAVASIAAEVRAEHQEQLDTLKKEQEEGSKTNDDRFSDLTERELSIVKSLSRPLSPLSTVRPQLKKTGSMTSLSIVEPAGLNRPTSTPTNVLLCSASPVSSKHPVPATRPNSPVTGVATPIPECVKRAVSPLSQPSSSAFPKLVKLKRPSAGGAISSLSTNIHLTTPPTNPLSNPFASHPFRPQDSLLNNNHFSMAGEVTDATTSTASLATPVALLSVKPNDDGMQFFTLSALLATATLSLAAASHSASASAVVPTIVIPTTAAATATASYAPITTTANIMTGSATGLMASGFVAVVAAMAL